jgi:hypothetical protein
VAPEELSLVDSYPALHPDRRRQGHHAETSAVQSRLAAACHAELVDQFEERREVVEERRRTFPPMRWDRLGIAGGIVLVPVGRVGLAVAHTSVAQRAAARKHCIQVGLQDSQVYWGLLLYYHPHRIHLEQWAAAGLVAGLLTAAAEPVVPGPGPAVLELELVRLGQPVALAVAAAAAAAAAVAFASAAFAASLQGSLQA